MADRHNNLLGDLLADLGKGRLAETYYLCGEFYPIEHVLMQLRRTVLEGQESAFNFDSLTVPEVAVREVVDLARTMPMLGSRRLVEVREAHLWTAAELEGLLPYIKAPSPSTCLVLIASKADLRLKFFSTFKKHGVLARFEPLKERQAPAWLSQEARRLRVPLAPGVAELIVEHVGTDMGQLASALERLSLYAGLGQTVAMKDVETLLAQTRQRSIFELTNAVGRGQRREALLVLGKMLQDREPAIRIVAMLARHVRLLWSAKELSGRRLPKNEIATALGIHPFFMADMIQQAQRLDEQTLQKTHHALFRADWRLKSSRLSEDMILEQLIFELCPTTRKMPRHVAGPHRG